MGGLPLLPLLPASGPGAAPPASLGAAADAPPPRLEAGVAHHTQAACARSQPESSQLGMRRRSMRALACLQQLRPPRGLLHCCRRKLDRHTLLLHCCC